LFEAGVVVFLLGIDDMTEFVESLSSFAFIRWGLRSGHHLCARARNPAISPSPCLLVHSEQDVKR
jgi:hypothetical protein